MPHNLWLNCFSIFLLLISLLFTQTFAAENIESFFQKKYSNYRNVLIIGWDGIERTRLNPLLAEGKLPNLSSIISKGRLVNLYIHEGETETKPGWAQHFSGYNSTRTGVLSNNDYQSIPEGWSFFERLRNKFHDKINLFMISGKIDNVSARGPHKICANCHHRDKKTGEHLNWTYPPFDAPTKDGQPPRLIDRNSEPFFYAAKKLDYFENLLGARENTAKKTSELLTKYKNKPFAAFVHFREPDEEGHLYGESSEGYTNAIIENDVMLGKILKKLQELSLDSNTILFIVSDHGFDKNGFEHYNAPETFLATNIQEIFPLMDRRDTTPTLLDLYGFKRKEIVPTPDGHSVLINEIGDHKINPQPPAKITRIGFFPDESNLYLLKLMNNKSNKNLKFYSKNPETLTWQEYKEEIPPQKERKNFKKKFAPAIPQATGEELIDLLLRNDIDVATTDINSFLKAAANGAPLIAIAELGFGLNESPTSGLYISAHFDIKKPEDLKGHSIGVIRTAGTDVIFLREFISSLGLNPDKDIRINEELYEDVLNRDIVKDRVDAFFYDNTKVTNLSKGHPPYKNFKFYEQKNWPNQKMNQVLLVTTKDKFEKRNKEISSLIKAYMKQFQELPLKTKLQSENTNSFIKDGAFGFHSIPLVKKELIDEYLRLLVVHKKLVKTFDITQSIDQSMTLKAKKELKIK